MNKLGLDKRGGQRSAAALLAFAAAFWSSPVAVADPQDPAPSEADSAAADNDGSKPTSGLDDEVNGLGILGNTVLTKILGGAVGNSQSDNTDPAGIPTFLDPDNNGSDLLSNNLGGVISNPLVATIANNGKDLLGGGNDPAAPAQTAPEAPGDEDAPGA